MQLTLTFGANSAANETVNPSIAALAEEIILWFVNPFLAATVEKRTIDPLLAFKFSCITLMISVADIKFKLKVLMKSSFLESFKGFKSIDPTQ